MNAESAWDEMGSRFKDGTIVNASRKELEDYLFALAVVQVRADFNQQRAYQTVIQALAEIGVIPAVAQAPTQLEAGSP